MQQASETGADEGRGRDAIAEAARWCAAARQLPGIPAVMAFGSRQVAYVLVGARRSLCIDRYGDPANSGEAHWARLEAFTRAPGLVAGYIGFDAVWPGHMPRPVPPPVARPVPTIHLFEPDGVLRVDARPGALPGFTMLRASPVLRALGPCEIGAGEILPLRSVDCDGTGFVQTVAQIIQAIKRGEAQRLTLTRRVDLPDDTDPLASFAAPPTPGAIAIERSFYLATPFLELAGHSPELLGSGNLERFACYKLSGTGGRVPDPVQDAQLLRSLLADPKILREHALSLDATCAALRTVGTVVSGPMQVIERRGLRHLMTPLTVSPRPDATLAEVLKALLPSGAQPKGDGLRLLDALERGSRGAYYGLIGLRLPDGEFEFSQVLRTLFRDTTGVHTFVGAAVTDGSTAEGESEETRLKLGDVVAVRRSDPDSGCAHPT
jgi:anthranilate/para-aminobenzoate synthase component I